MVKTSKRGKLDHRGWIHHDIPVSTCRKCNHHIYRDEDYEHDSYVDASGNNARDYYHKKCPNHETTVRKIIVERRCLECGATHSEDFIGRF